MIPNPLLVLASTSPYRRSLLQRLQWPFEVRAPGVPEDALPGERPPDRALRLATAKARAIAVELPEAIVIGSDQVASVGTGTQTQVLDKPGDAAHCAELLSRLSGQAARFETAVCVIWPGGSASHTDLTVVQFRTLTTAQIERYIEREAAFDCAGGFKAEGLGIALLERIESDDPTALVGLPLIWLAGALRRAGLMLP